MTKREQQQRDYQLEVGEQVLRIRDTLGEFSVLYSDEMIAGYVIHDAIAYNTNRAVDARVFPLVRS